MFSKFMSLDSERRDTILNAGFKEFAKKGFDDASTNVISKESGISKPLMFHYVKSKKDFFLFLYDYCLDVLEKEYFSKIDRSQKDIFERLRKTCLLKIQVMKKYPWIFDFVKTAVLMDSDMVKERRKMVEENSFERFYGDIDTSKFREELDKEKSKRLIFWAIGGYADQVLEELKNSNTVELDFEKISTEFDSYLDELKKTYYM
ncbi:hypothetical protein GCM10025886_14980 [Tetragenococcus halophilus subsp. flandriensis]|nr:hypothetical protein GCM10025886_14980 [Tetragenococcus halophilus subsp. flandriensis]